jgi:hypothetical protein
MSNPALEIEQWEMLRERWKQVEVELEKRIISAQSKALDGGVTRSMEDVAELRGRVQAYRELQRLPEARIKELETISGKKKGRM